MSKKSTFLLFFFIGLIAAFLLLLYISDKNVLSKRYKTVSTVLPFKFVNQFGKEINERDLEGKVVLVNYFFTTCRTICPKMNTKVKELYEQYKANPDFLILSHTAMPDTDSVPVLKRYADSMQAGANWMFLTGSKKDLYFAARKSYILDDPNQVVTNPDEDFIHTQLFALVNRNGKLKKKVYDSFNAKEMTELREDIQLALDGKL
jgi:protein SCO1